MKKLLLLLPLFAAACSPMPDAPSFKGRKLLTEAIG